MSVTSLKILSQYYLKRALKLTKRVKVASRAKITLPQLEKFAQDYLSFLKSFMEDNEDRADIEPLAEIIGDTVALVREFFAAISQNNLPEVQRLYSAIVRKNCSDILDLIDNLEEKDPEILIHFDKESENDLGNAARQMVGAIRGMLSDTMEGVFDAIEKHRKENPELYVAEEEDADEDYEEESSDEDLKSEIEREVGYNQTDSSGATRHDQERMVLEKQRAERSGDSAERIKRRQDQAKQNLRKLTRDELEKHNIEHPSIVEGCRICFLLKNKFKQKLVPGFRELKRKWDSSWYNKNYSLPAFKQKEIKRVDAHHRMYMKAYEGMKALNMSLADLEKIKEKDSKRYDRLIQIRTRLNDIRLQSPEAFKRFEEQAAAWKTKLDRQAKKKKEESHKKFQDKAEKQLEKLKRMLGGM